MSVSLVARQEGVAASLLFQWRQIKERGRGLTFDDVLIVPAKSDVRSRRDPQLTTQLTKKIQIETPIVSANMDTITRAAMAVVLLLSVVSGWRLAHTPNTIGSPVH